MATTWEYATVPLIIHATKAILDQWGADGWELIDDMATGITGGEGLVLKRERSGRRAPARAAKAARPTRKTAAKGGRKAATKRR